MAELSCVVRDKNGKELTDEELSKKVIENDLYYKVMATVIRRLEEQREAVKA